MDKRIILTNEMMNNIAKKKKWEKVEDKIYWIVLYIIGAYIVSLLIDLLIK